MKKSILILMIVLIFMMCFCLNVRAETLPTTKWNLYFENIEITEGSVTAIKPPKIKGSSNSEIDFRNVIKTDIPRMAFKKFAKGGFKFVSSTINCSSSPLERRKSIFKLFNLNFTSATKSEFVIFFI